MRHTCFMHFSILQSFKPSHWMMSFSERGSCGVAFGTEVLVTKERAAWLTAANIPSEHFQVQPCEPHKASTDQLSQYSMRGCIWTVSRKGLRKSLGLR